MRAEKWGHQSDAMAGAAPFHPGVVSGIFSHVSTLDCCEPTRVLSWRREVISMAPIDTIHTLDELAASTPRLQQMLEPARGLSAPPADAKTAPASRLNIRTLPTSPLSKTAAWSTGLAPSETLGPFRDKLGQPVWVDVFSTVRNLRFERS